MVILVLSGAPSKRLTPSNYLNLHGF